MELNNYIRSLLRLLKVVPSTDETLLDETDRNNLAAGDYIVTTVAESGQRHTFLTMRGWDLAQG